MAPAASKQILVLWRKPIPQNIPFLVAELFQDLLTLNQHVCKNIKTIDTYLLVIPRKDLQDLLNDPVFYFPQVKLICVYCENNESYEQDQITFQCFYPRLRFCHERDIPKELAAPIINHAVDPRRQIDRAAITFFASSVTQRLSTKRPAITSRRSSIQRTGTFASLRGFIVKNMESIDARFKCPVCQLIFREPHQLKCGHRTCQACLTSENDEISCSTCAQISLRPNIRRDKGFQRELDELLILCAICGFPDCLKRYQEHLDRVHQEHINTVEVQRTNYSLVVALLRSINNDDQRQNSFVEIQHRIRILLHCVNLLKDDQQRIQVDLYCSENCVQTISEKLASLKSAVQYNAAIFNEIELNTDIVRHEISSLKQKLEDSMILTDDGTYLWRIPFVAKSIANAVSGRNKSIYSPIFRSSPFGYKMRMRLYLNGDSDVRGEYLSLFAVIMRGDYDDILTWPYSYQIRFELVDQSTLDHNQRNISAEFWPDTTSSCFQCPKFSMNEPYGIKRFVSLEWLKTRLNFYIQDDVMFIQFKTDFLAERPASLANTGTGATANDM